MTNIAIVDYGSQYTHLIECRLRELGYNSDVVMPDECFDKLLNYKALILSGGPRSVFEKDAPQLSQALSTLIFEKEIPTLAICYGMQLLCQHLANKSGYDSVKKSDTGKAGGKSSSEYGKTVLKISCQEKILEGVPSGEVVWMSHGDYVYALPPNSHSLASTDNLRNAAVALINHSVYCLQFHPEVSQTKNGSKIIQNFIAICQISPDWDSRQHLQAIKEDTLKRVQNKHIIAFISGGNDSSVLAEFLKSVIPAERLHFFYVQGLDPATSIQNIRLLDPGITIVNASRKFFTRLKEVYNPEEKRVIIGKIFVEIWEEETRKLARKLNIKERNFILAQGTIYPDVIESGGSKHADIIKSHHNRIREVQELIKVGAVIEPFSDLFKGDVREIGRILNLDRRLISQHPQPGPRDAIRVICSPARALPDDNLLDIAFSDEKDIQKFCGALGYSAWLIPIKSKGIQGDQSTYKYTVGLVGKYRREELLTLANAIPNQFSDTINRVVYVSSPADTTSLAFLGVRKCDFNPETKKIADHANSILVKSLHLANIYNSVSQAFAVVAPVSFDSNGYGVVIRAVETQDFMTASCYWLPERLLFSISKEIMKSIPEIQIVLYDLTSKPPGTIEWE